MQQMCIATGQVTELKTLYTCMEYFLFRILFTCDVTAAILVLKNKSISLLW